jgi:hypothetical protein
MSMSVSTAPTAPASPEAPNASSIVVGCSATQVSSGSETTCVCCRMPVSRSSSAASARVLPVATSDGSTPTTRRVIDSSVASAGRSPEAGKASPMWATSTATPSTCNVPRPSPMNKPAVITSAPSRASRTVRGRVRSAAPFSRRRATRGEPPVVGAAHRPLETSSAGSGARRRGLPLSHAPIFGRSRLRTHFK